MNLIHLMNPATQVWKNPDLTWMERLNQAVLPVVEATSIRDVLVRYPFGWPETGIDYYFTGYYELQQRRRVNSWATFVTDLNEFAAQHNVRWWIYAGYLGGQHDGARVPADPNLSQRENDPNALRWMLDHCLTPMEKVNPHVIYFDAVGRLAENNVYARWLNAVKAQHTAGRIGIETPHPDATHFHDMPTASTWNNFLSATQPREDYPNGYWGAFFKDPRCVFIQSNLQGVDDVRAETISRTKQVLAAGGYAALNMRDFTMEEFQ